MKKRILYILHFPPPVHGSSVIGLQIKESKVINANYDARYINLGTSKSIDEIQKFTFSKIFSYLSILIQVFKNLIFHRPDLCYLAITAEGVPFYKDTLVVLLVKLFRVKLVYHLHNKGVINKQDRFLDNLLYRFVFRNTDVILLSSFLYSDIQKYVPLSAVHYCPNGIKAFENTIIPERENERIEILFLSNMIRSKGVFVLLEACNILNKRNVYFHCTYIGGSGDITEEEFKTKVAEYKLDTSISYVGKKLGREKNDFLANANIFVLPTYYEKECFPLVLLEAMQANLPVISTYEGGIPDIIEDGITGYLVPQKDANALAEKLEMLIQNKMLSIELGKNGRIRFEKNFTLQHFEHTLSAVLEQIIFKSC